MNTTDASTATRFKVGIFTILGLLTIGAIAIFVNDRPFWYRSCQLVHINVDDATGLKPKSPIRSLGLEIGYLKSVQLSETHVTLGICITAPVEVLPSTRAYLRGEGFLGDKFVELKPVKYVGEPIQDKPAVNSSWIDFLIPSAYAQDEETARKPRGGRPEGREIPVGSQNQDMQALVNRVDSLVNEMTSLTTNLKTAINPEDLKKTLNQLNRTLENASRTLSPEGGLNQTAQRTLAKLEDAIEQLRSVMTRVNQGEGSVGMLLNDPSYAQEIKETIKNANKLLSKVGNVRFVVDVGGEQLTAYNGGRGWFRLGIWPKTYRYYLLGISVDPRGRRTEITTSTTSGGVTSDTSTVQIETTGILLTAMVGRLFYQDRIDLAIGALHGDGAVSIGLNLGRKEHLDELKIINDIYSRGGSGIDNRVTIIGRPFADVYLRAGIESVREVRGQLPFFFGAGVSFDDEDIKLLFALR